MTISPKQIIFLATLLPLLSAIFLPLIPKRPRCMMVYTIGEIQSVKIFLNLPQLKDQTREQYYTFTMRNTESEDTKTEQIQHGTFNKEYDLTPNVIYEVCLQLQTTRNIENTVVQYKAQTAYNIEHSELKVPENLLKKEDFRATYEAAYHIEQTVKDYKTLQGDRDVSSNDHFVETKHVDKRLITISIVEILIILGAGVYQFFSLKNYLISKQYI